MLQQGWFPTGGTLTMVEGNLFLGSSTIVLQAVDPESTVNGLIVQGNVFHTTNTHVKINFLVFIENLFENTDGVLRLPPYFVLSRDGSLLPSFLFVLTYPLY